MNACRITALSWYWPICQHGHFIGYIMCYQKKVAFNFCIKSMYIHHTPARWATAVFFCCCACVTGEATFNYTVMPHFFCTFTHKSNENNALLKSSCCYQHRFVWYWPPSFHVLRLNWNWTMLCPCCMMIWSPACAPHCVRNIWDCQNDLSPRLTGTTLIGTFYCYQLRQTKMFTSALICHHFIRNEKKAFWNVWLKVKYNIISCSLSIHVMSRR